MNRTYAYNPKVQYMHGNANAKKLKKKKQQTNRQGNQKKNKNKKIHMANAFSATNIHTKKVLNSFHLCRLLTFNINPLVFNFIIRCLTAVDRDTRFLSFNFDLIRRYLFQKK